MGYTTREYESTAFSTAYPAYYTETQIHNWSPVDIVITDMHGHQETLPKWPGMSSTTSAHVEIQFRRHVGPRTKQNKNGTITELPVKAWQYIIDYDELKQCPIYVEELGYVISTVEHSLIAKSYLEERQYCPELVETAADFRETNPRFVFEVYDPAHRWDILYMHFMGQTIELECKHFKGRICDIFASEVNIEDRSTLTCYMRYPSESIVEGGRTQQVFKLNLGDIDLELPYRIPSGDLVCIAPSKEALQRVLAKKAEGSRVLKIEGMVTKEAYESAVKNLELKCKEAKDQAEETARVSKIKTDTEIATLKQKLAAEEGKTADLQQQIEAHKALLKAYADQKVQETKIAERHEKLQQERAATSKQRIETDWTALKIVGGLAVTVITFAIAMLAKNRK